MRQLGQKFQICEDVLVKHLRNEILVPALLKRERATGSRLFSKNSTLFFGTLTLQAAVNSKLSIRSCVKMLFHVQLCYL